MTGQVLIQTDGAVRTLTLDNPGARNAINLQMSAQLCAGLREASLDPAVRVVVLTGSGGAFCAGGDVKAMAAGRDAGLTVEQRADRLRDRAEAARLLHEMSKPTVALVEGAVAGAGLGLALACDFRFASSTVKLTTAFVRVGLAGDFGVNWFLTRMLGVARARERAEEQVDNDLARRTALITESLNSTAIDIAKVLFTTYLLPFEIASFVLLTALIGVVVLHQRQS